VAAPRIDEAPADALDLWIERVVTADSVDAVFDA